jgi:N-acetylglucosamine-6-phosphate deacetylase
MIRVKTPARTILTCDASGWAGSPPGVYENEFGNVEVLVDGRIVVAGQDQFLSGSGAGTDICIARAIEYGQVSLKEAIDMASRNPCRLLGCEEAELRPGSLADLFVFRYPGPPANLEILTTIASGEVRYGSLPIVA